jgi:hypothetical protein
MSDPKQALIAVGGGESFGTFRQLPNIPAAPRTDDAGMSNFLSSVKSWMEQASGHGLTGFATKQDLFDIGAIYATPDGSYGPKRAPNATVPPVPTGVLASGAFTNIIVEWDDPHKAYGNHAYTEIWAAESDNFTAASIIGESPGFNFSHAVGEGSTRYYWIRFVSTSDVKGPYQSVGGILGQTAPPVEFLMETLSGELGDQPYFDVPVATVIDGVAIPAGRYMKSAFIVNGAITNAKIKNAAVDSAKIADASITNAKIQDAAINSAKIEDASIYAAKIADAAITSAKIKEAAIKTAHIGDAQIGSAQIVNAAITAAKIGELAVDTLHIKNAAVTSVTSYWHYVDWAVNNPQFIPTPNAIFGTPVDVTVVATWDWPGRGTILKAIIGDPYGVHRVIPLQNSAAPQINYNTWTAGSDSFRYIYDGSPLYLSVASNDAVQMSVVVTFPKR